MLSEVLVVLDGHIFCVVFNIDEYVIVSIFCAVLNFLVFFLVLLVPMVPATVLDL